MTGRRSLRRSAAGWLAVAWFALAAVPGLSAADSALYLRLAELHPADHPTAQGDLEFARQVERLTGGRIRVEVSLGGVLGDELSVLEQLRFGGIDLARVSIATVEPGVPTLAALFMPYLYRDEDHMWRVLGGPVGRKLLEDIRADGLVGVGWFEAGSRSFYTAQAPVTRVDDLKGLRVRVQESPPMMSLVQAFGARPVPMAFPTVYQGLMTGAVDGAENNLPTYYASGHYRAAPHYTSDDHARLPELLIGSGVSFAAIGPEDQALILLAAERASEYQRRAWAVYEAQIKDKLRAAGVVFHPAADLPRWQEKARRIWEAQAPAVRELLGRIHEVR